MNAFWREEPLTETEVTLLQLCFKAHEESAMRNNFSSVAVAQSAVSSGDLTKAVTAGLSMLGGMHAPLLESYRNLTIPQLMESHSALGNKISGWGNSFEKGHPDPIWEPVSKYLQDHFPNIHGRICEITDALHKAGKPVYANPSCFTAAVGIAVKMPESVLPWILIAGRMTAWTTIFLNASRGNT